VTESVSLDLEGVKAAIRTELWILHLLVDRIEIGVHERSQRDVHPATVMRQLRGSKASALTTSRDSGAGWSCVE
jgi:hypothetical protein